MTAAPSIELRATTSLETVRVDLLDVYAAVRAPLFHLPNYAVTAFGERLDRHGSEPGFTAVLAYADRASRSALPLAEQPAVLVEPLVALRGADV
ncbi:hypothetical protein GCM10009802_54310 [Streptomyces synnematoformans]|uniref:GNAT family N-acetyltransferase n=1 Tax=Streptomyces synnematoformans TaxID=415721 RepID=A0ABP4K981_9ACTN